jgi:hypothetical protein
MQTGKMVAAFMEGFAGAAVRSGSDVHKALAAAAEEAAFQYKIAPEMAMSMYFTFAKEVAV